MLNLMATLLVIHPLNERYFLDMLVFRLGVKGPAPIDTRQRKRLVSLWTRKMILQVKWNGYGLRHWFWQEINKCKVERQVTRIWKRLTCAGPLN